MIWQDFAMMIILTGFAYALVPQVIQGFKNKESVINIQTSILNSIGLFTLSWILTTLGLYYSAGVNIIAASLWLTLLIQRFIYKKK